MNSHHCVGIEMARALERAAAGAVQVMPIILRPCDWTSSEIGRLKARPTDAQPFVKFPTLDEGFKTANAFVKNYLYAANPGGLDSDLQPPGRPASAPRSLDECKSASIPQLDLPAPARRRAGEELTAKPGRRVDIVDTVGRFRVPGGMPIQPGCDDVAATRTVQCRRRRCMARVASRTPLASARCAAGLKSSSRRFASSGERTRPSRIFVRRSR
jgi:hypothetical protein